jgi:glycosidase
VPFVYYGEELGLANGPGGEDEWKRTPMPWTAGGGEGSGFTSGEPWHPFAPGRETANVAVEAADPGSLLSRYRDLIRLRKATPALARGDFEVLEPRQGGGAVLAVLRRSGEARVLVAHNLSGESQVTFVNAAGRLDQVLWSDPGAGLVVGEAGMELVLPPGASAVWRLR